ncbi:MAG TPA: hypothetical protein VIZ65_14775 [Cellvibrionaceae bacterium]
MTADICSMIFSYRTLKNNPLRLQRFFPIIASHTTLHYRNLLQSLSAVLAAAFLASTAFGSQLQGTEFGITPLASGYQLAEQAAEKLAEGKYGSTKEAKPTKVNVAPNIKMMLRPTVKKRKVMQKRASAGEG